MLNPNMRNRRSRLRSPGIGKMLFIKPESTIPETSDVMARPAEIAPRSKTGAPMTTTRFHGVIRYCQTARIGSSRVVGVVGLVRNEGDPIPLLPIRVSRESDLDYAIESVTGEAEDRLMSLAIDSAARQTSVTPTADSILAWMKKDYAKRKHRSPFSHLLLDAEEESEAARVVSQTIRAVLRSDPFKTASDFCSSMEISGNMTLLRLFEPICAQVAEIARRQDTINQAARTMHEAFSSNAEWKPHGAIWAENVTEAPTAAPAP